MLQALIICVIVILSLRVDALLTRVRYQSRVLVKPPMRQLHYTQINMAVSPTQATLTNTTSFDNIPNTPGNPRGPIKKILALATIISLRVQITFLKFLILFSKNKQNSSTNLANLKRKKKTGFARLLELAATAVTSRRFWLQLLLLSISVFSVGKIMSAMKSLVVEVPYSSFMKLLSSSPERIQDLRISPTSFSYLLDGRAAFSRNIPLPPAMIDRLISSGVQFSAAANPLSIIGVVWTLGYCWFLWRLNSRSLGGPPDEGVGKRKDGMLQEYGSLSFNDVAGQEKAKQEVSELCEMLRQPERYSNVGARLPSGILLVGPPGTGKTLLARVTAAEAGVPFFSCSASDFVEVFVGRGPARVRKLFKQASDNAPCIIFIDELDSIGRSRRLGSMNSEQESTLNQILTAMDGLDTSNNGVIVMAATNRAELLDPALLRAGRFDRIVQCPLPDRHGRLSILLVHTKKLQVSNDVDLDRIARLTPGTCGADLATIVNEAAIRTARRGGALITTADFDDALKSFFSGRGVSVSGLTEMVGVQVPSWLKQLASGNSNMNEPQPGLNN